MLKFPVRLFLFILIPVIPLIIFSSSFPEGSEGGPLFLQVHYTSPLSGVSSEQLSALLSGKPLDTAAPSVTGTFEVFADSAVADGLIEQYPQLKAKRADFSSSSLSSLRNFIGISDSRGLQPCFKVLPVDGVLPWTAVDDAARNESAYPFTAGFARQWDSSGHVSVVQTGVTAMTRAFIPAVKRSGDVLSPVRETWEITSSADIAMTSNEVSFDDKCTYPFKDRMSFCSPKEYYRILQKSGFDVIELTGNHNNDYGTGNSIKTLDMYEKDGIVCFGGGRNTDEAERIRYVDVKGTRFAFTGFNQWGPPQAWAGNDSPGAARLTREKFFAAVKEAAAKADIVFVSVQWGNENSPVPHPIQTEYFRKAAEMGAHILVSSSAHRPMGIEFHAGRFISYGLGNFLFDQMQTVNHRRGLIARHHFYRKRHIQTELIPYLIHSHSRPVLQKGADAGATMSDVFRYSLGETFGK